LSFYFEYLGFSGGGWFRGPGGKLGGLHTTFIPKGPKNTLVRSEHALRIAQKSNFLMYPYFPDVVTHRKGPHWSENDEWFT
jgi:hypothetical protein